MKITKQARRNAKSIFQECTQDGRLDENRVRQTVQKLLSQKPRGYLGVLTHFQRLLKLDAEQRRARVEAASPMADDLRESIRQNLARIYGPNLNIEFTINPALIGGLRIQVGSDVYDGSIQARLTELQSKF